MVTSFSRGHLTVWIPDKNKWIYADTKELIDEKRTCIRCGKFPTKEGHDACLGHIENVSSACCGHGIMESFKRR